MRQTTALEKHCLHILPGVRTGELWLWLVILSGLVISCNGPTPISVETPTQEAPFSLRALQNRTYEATLTQEKALAETEDWRASLWSYYSDSLKVYTLINTPKKETPTAGFPVLIFGHGFHPDPPNYGISNETGEDWRPGDYYRGIPEAYAERGFLVLTPDYRGHNVSDGFEYTQRSFLASTYYAIDVLHLLAALPGLANADLSRIYYLGHSMGGDVGMKTLLATDQFKAASLWAPVTASTWEQGLYYGKMYASSQEEINADTLRGYMARFDSITQALGDDYASTDGDPIFHLPELTTPLLLHHGQWERAVPYAWSERLAAELYRHDKTFTLYTYDTENHLFKNENRQQAIERDVAFFLDHH